MDIVDRFVASGHGEVERAFAGIEQRARASKKATDDAGKAQRAASAPAATRQRASGEDRAAAASAKRAADAKIREADRAQRHVARIRDRHFADEQRQYERHQREIAKREVRARERAAAESRRSREKSFGTLKDIGTGAVLGAAATAVAVAAAAARQALTLDDAARGFAISGRKSGEQFGNHDAIRRGISRTAIENKGVTSADLAAGLASFQALTGNTKQALALQGTFATTASASGGSAVDVAEAAASLSQSFDISSIEDMQEAMAALVAQGKEGAVELKDVASLFQRLAAAGSSFGLPKGLEGVRMLGGLTQLAKTGTGSPEQAATAVENIFSAFTNKQKDLQAIGVNVFDKKTGKARAFEDLMAETIGKAGGNDMAKKKATLSKIFDVMGGRGVNPLTTTYMDAFNAASGTDTEKQASAMDAVKQKILASANAAGTWSDVQEDAAMRQKSASAQVTSAWEAVVAKVGDALLPSLGKLAEKLASDEVLALMDPFIESLQFAAEVVTFFADALYDTGIIKKKPKTKAEAAADAQKALEKFDKKAGIGPLTPEEQAKRDALAATAASAQDAVFEKAGTSGKGMTKDEFVAQYMAAGGIAPEDKGSVDMLAGALQKDTTGARSNDFFQRVFGGENQAQQDIRHQFESAVTAQKTIGQGEAEQNLSALAANAKTASDALAKFNAGQQGSIVTGQ